MANIPSIESSLYAANSVADVINRYQTVLQEDGSVESLLVSAKLQEVLSMISDVNFLSEILSIFDELYQAIVENYPDLYFILEGRRKSLLRTVAKIYSLVENNRSLDDIRDIYAFRLILLDDSPEEQVDNCYLLMNKLIPFFIRKGFIPCEAAAPAGTKGFSKSDYPSIVVPERSLLNPSFSSSVKDYIISPKRKGYQSLHIAFRDPVSGRCFEIQIRTFSMHVHAESGDANHLDYETEKYDAILFEKEKIKMRGFRVGADGSISDMIGLLHSQNIIARQKTLPYAI